MRPSSLEAGAVKISLEGVGTMEELSNVLANIMPQDKLSAWVVSQVGLDVNYYFV